MKLKTSQKSVAMLQRASSAHRRVLTPTPVYIRVAAAPGATSIRMTGQGAVRTTGSRAVACEAAMKALIFDVSRGGGGAHDPWTLEPQQLPPLLQCDGVILESEDLHRQAYNAAFRQFDVKIDGHLVHWDVEFYDDLQNRVGEGRRVCHSLRPWRAKRVWHLPQTPGGGKPKMRWFFGEHRKWPTSILFNGRAPESDVSRLGRKGPSPHFLTQLLAPYPCPSQEERSLLIDELQDWKTEKYQSMITSGEVPPRPGVLRLMDEASNHRFGRGSAAPLPRSARVRV